MKSRMIRWEGHTAYMGETRKVYAILIGKPEKRDHAMIPRHRRKDNVRMDLRDIGWKMWSGFI
jgi:hypothetical protein